MATNKFATMLQRNTHKIIVILVYAVVEWILIILLLLNSFFTYLIRKFANYFGLEPPCVWCSRVDHVLDPGKSTNSYRDLACDTHATVISTLSYCPSHKKLAETKNMCTECLASRPEQSKESIAMTRRMAFVSWVSTHKLESGDQDLRCSCCNESLKSQVYPPYLLFKSSWGSLDYTQKARLIIEALDDASNGGDCKEQRKPESLSNHNESDNEVERNNAEESRNEKDAAEEFQVVSDIDSFGLTEVTEENCSRSVSNLQYEEKDAYEGKEAGKNSVHSSCDNTIIRCCSGEDDLLEVINLGSEGNVDCSFTRVIPIRLIDSLTTENQGSLNLEDELIKTQDHESRAFHSAIQSETQASTLGQAELMEMDERTEKTRKNKLERSKTGMDEEQNSSVPKAGEEIQDLIGEVCIQVSNNQADLNLSIFGNEVESETMNQQSSLTDQTKCKNSASMEAADDAASQPQAQEPVSSLPCVEDDQFSTHYNSAEVINISKENMVQNDLNQKHTEKSIVQEKLNLVDGNQEGIKHNLSTRSETNEAEEEKFPETPTSLDSFHYSHKKLLLLEKRESGMEESVDGSVVSEMEGSDPVLTIERLKSALRVERKALSALYSELEEERSASAIAANQTMAMITRLQEEKAAMQMEALQYQRMMEEQAEYDQEALQLLNELMVKRETEKQELEKELEVHRKKVVDYEAKEKMGLMRSINGSVRSRNSSVSCSNSEDIDKLSIDLNCEARDEDGSFSGHQESSSDKSPADEVINLEEMALDCVKHMTALDESMTEYEEERLSILDQLKVLEGKLLTLRDDEFIEDLKSIEQSSNLNINEFKENHDHSSSREEGVSNCCSQDRLNPERMPMASMAKSLLPLLDAADNETEQGIIYEEQVEFGSVEMKNSSVSAFDHDSKRLAIEEEVDHVYGRLHDLEADREFLKHCMTSGRKGDEGMDLLQEILQHLHDLQAVELQNMNDDTLV